MYSKWDSQKVQIKKQCLMNQYCRCWWPGALAPGHKQQQCWPNPHYTSKWPIVNTLRPRQNGRHFPDDIFKCIFLNENIWILIKFSLKFVPKGPINNIPSLVQIMAWRRPGDKPLSEPTLVSLLMHICVTRPQWVKGLWSKSYFEFCKFFKGLDSKPCFQFCRETKKIKRLLSIIIPYLRTRELRSMPCKAVKPSFRSAHEALERFAKISATSCKLNLALGKTQAKSKVIG